MIADAQPRLRLELLDGFELRAGPDAVPVPFSGRRVLAFLALHRRPLQRGFVAGSLWIDAGDQRAGASLRSALWRLNRPGVQAVKATPTHLAIEPQVAVDLHEATALAHATLEGSLAIETLAARD